MPKLTAKPEAIDIDLEQTALLVVDMQNAFATKGGMFDLAGFDISGAAPVVGVNKKLIDDSRAAGVQVVYLQMTYKPGLQDGGGPESPNYHKELGLVMMRERADLNGKLLVEGSWDWKIVDVLKPETSDIIVTKPRYSGFCNTDLEAILRGRNIRNLLFTGIATNVCVESTARDAYFSEFWPILIEDAMNNSGPDFNRQSTLWNFEHVFGWVTKSENVLALFSS